MEDLPSIEPFIGFERAMVAKRPAKGSLALQSGELAGHLDRRTGEVLEWAASRHSPAFSGSAVPARRMLELARELGVTGDPLVRQALARYTTLTEINRFTQLRIAAAARAGQPVGAEASITKPPSAELRPNQTDQDSLPPYDVLDEIIERYVEGRQSPSRIIEETGIDEATVRRVARLVDLSEYKRKQAAIGLKVTSVAFGSGRRWPIAQRWRPV